MVTLNLRDDCNGRVATNFKRGMTDKRFLELEITAWLTSPERKKQLEGEAYYDGYQDVTHRERLALDENGKPIVLKNLPNNRLVNNLYSKMVDQKTNYSFGRPLSFDTENKEYAKALGALFGARFLRTMHNVGEGAWIGGKSWLYPYYENGELAFLLMRSCHSGRTLTTPSWTLLSMSMWCRNTMRPNTPRMWSR